MITNDYAYDLAKDISLIAKLYEFLEGDDYIVEIKSQRAEEFRLPYDAAEALKTSLMYIIDKFKKEKLKDLQEWVEQ